MKDPWSHFLTVHLSDLSVGGSPPGTLSRADFFAVVIDKLINTNKEIEAIYFVHYSGLSNRFPSESLLKEYHQASRRKSSSISEDGNNSPAALQESNNLEMTALRSIIKCVESCNLESKFSTSELKRRLAKLEKVKADRKKPAVLKKFWSKRSAPRDLSQPDSTYCGSMYF
ncbi:FRIGIDA-like protein 4a [Zingiber officinale]|uniref:FRIGIDA-like protein 4a n=1 Tax=Zingiber officinale TaxID=94328 RepID=UPI001C4AFD1C|nr:FRIGIDA-like protein 4a [Zingiber officinale]